MTVNGPINTGGLFLLMLENQQQAEDEASGARDAAHELGVAFLKIGNVYKEMQRSQEKFEDTVQWINAGLSVVSVGQSAVNLGAAANAQAQAAANASAKANAPASAAVAPTAGDPNNLTGAAQQSQVQADQAAKVDARAGQGAEVAHEQLHAHDSLHRNAGPPGETPPRDPQANAEKVSSERAEEKPLDPAEEPVIMKGRTEKPGVWDIAKGGYGIYEQFARGQLKLDDEIDKHGEDRNKATSKGFFEVADEAHDAYDGERELTKQMIDVIRNGDKKDVVG